MTNITRRSFVGGTTAVLGTSLLPLPVIAATTSVTGELYVWLVVDGRPYLKRYNLPLDDDFEQSMAGVWWDDVLESIREMTELVPSALPAHEVGSPVLYLVKLRSAICLRLPRGIYVESIGLVRRVPYEVVEG